MKEKQVVELNLSDILPNRFQPRIKFDEKAIIELSESIKEHGVIQPIIVRKINDKYEIIAGERRYKASVMAGRTTIPAIIVDLNDKDSSEIALIENVQRQDLTPIEEAISYRKILDMGYLTQEALASKLGVSQSTIANKLRLLNLDDEVQEALLDGKISERHARSLLRLNKMSDQRIMLKKIIDERFTVRKTDEVITSMLKNKDINILGSIESNANKAFEMQNKENIINNNNPFMIDNQNDKINDHNVEVLDFGFEEIKPQEETKNILNPSSIEENNFSNGNIPLNPIIEDVESNQLENESVSKLSIDENIYANNENLVDEFEFNTQNNNSENFFSSSNNENINISQPKVDFNDKNENEISETNKEDSFNNNINEIEQPSSRPGRFFNMFPQSTDNQENLENQTSNNLSSPSLFVDNSFENNIFNQNINIIENESNQETTLSSEPESTANVNIFNTFPSYNVPNQENINQTSEEVDPPITQVITQLPTETLDIFDNEEQNQSEEKEILSSNLDINEEIPSTPNLRNLITQIRKFADEIEKQGFEIDSEEFDFEDMYQVIFKINKK